MFPSSHSSYAHLLNRHLLIYDYMSHCPKGDFLGRFSWKIMYGRQSLAVLHIDSGVRSMVPFSRAGVCPQEEKRYLLGQCWLKPLPVITSLDVLSWYSLWPAPCPATPCAPRGRPGGEMPARRWTRWVKLTLLMLAGTVLTFFSPKCLFC